MLRLLLEEFYIKALSNLVVDNYYYWYLCKVLFVTTLEDGIRWALSSNGSLILTLTSKNSLSLSNNYLNAIVI